MESLFSRVRIDSRPSNTFCHVAKGFCLSKKQALIICCQNSSKLKLASLAIPSVQYKAKTQVKFPLSSFSKSHFFIICRPFCPFISLVGGTSLGKKGSFSAMRYIL